MEDLFAANGKAGEWLDMAVQMVMQYAPKVVLALLTLVIGLWLINRVVNVLDARLKAKDPSLNKFLCGLVGIILKILLLISVASMVGIATTSFIAVIGAAGLAIGLALQGTLSNLAAGVMIILFRPYKLGDFVEVAGQAGSVKDITLFTTELATGDNKKVIVPNGAAWGDVITNYSANPTRRVDFTFSIDYSDDIDKAMDVIKSTLGADARIHKDPEIFTAVAAHGSSSVDIVTRVWVNTGDYWGVHFDAMKSVKEAFDKNGISIPYPHQVNVEKKD